MVTLRIFISSPGDVGEERRLTERVIDRLRYEWSGRAALEPIFWEHEPLRATAGFQEQLPLPSQADIVVCILWSRLGTRLPGRLARPDGTPYASGTEFEFEDALRAFKERGLPDLLVYRKTARAVTDLEVEAQVLERLEQKKALDGFVDKWFRDREGSFTAAFHNFDSAARFEEVLEAHLGKLIAARVRREAGGEAAPARPLWPAGSPFRGLQTFEVEHAAVFCGRTAQVGDVLNALRRQATAGRPFVLVAGMSGCGKSSLVKAGVLPELTSPNVIEGVGLWRSAILIPGNAASDLLGGLAQALLADGALSELRQSGMGARELALLLAERPETAVPMIRSGLAQAAREVERRERLEREPVSRLALVVDQLEELFTSEGITAADRERFDAALGTLARSGVVWVLATLRSDFYARLAELPEVMKLKEGAGQYDLRSPGAAEIGQMIRQPAKIAGLRFEEDGATGERLDDVLRDAAVREPAALPLLEFALDELYKRRTAEGLLTFEAYRELKGVEGALAHRAEELFASLPPAAQAALPAVLPALVTLGTDEEGAVTRRRAPLAAVAATPAAKALVDAFIADRLLVTDRAEDGVPVVSVAHEALLHRWPRAQQWLADNEALLKTSARLKSAAALWQQDGEGEGFLLPPGRLLGDGEALLASGAGHLGPAEAKLIRASLAAAEADRRRQGARRLAATVAAALLVALAILAWDLWFREHVSYYSAWTKRWGVPEGIGELSDDDAGRRQWSLKLYRRGRLGPVTRFEAVNGSGHLTPYHLVNRYMTDPTLDPRVGDDRECAWEFEYDEQGRLTREIARNRAGRAVYEFQYKGGPSADGVVTAEFTRDGVAAAQAGSGAALIRFTRTAEGLDKKTLYFDNDGAAKPGRDGSYGSMVEEFDARGLPLSEVVLGPDGYPALHPDGYVKLVTRYDEQGRPVEGTFFDRTGRPTLTRHGFARVVVGYDEHGNVAELELFDEHGQPMRGVASWRFAHDERGNLVRVSFLDGERRPTYYVDGSFGNAMEYDDRGNVVAATFLDEHGKPIAGPAGIARTGLEYDAGGNVTALSFHDRTGRPARQLGGVAKVVTKYDDEGNVVEERSVDAAGAPIRLPAGYAIVQKRYDANRNQIEEAYFDERGEPTRNAEGVMRWQATYDARGRMVAKRYLDEAGEPMASWRGEAGLRWASDDAGTTVEETYFDIQGRPLVMAQGFASRRSRYDQRGAETAVEHLDPEGLPVAVDGCARLSKVYDFRGNLVEQRCLGAAGEPAAFADGGHSTLRTHYDERGREVGRSYLDAAGEPVAAQGGVARVRWRSDRLGNKVEETYFDEAGQPTLHPRGHARLTKTYNPWGGVLEEAYRDQDGDLVRTAERYARVSRRYGERGEILGEEYFDEHGGRVRTDQGFARTLYRYDDRGRPVELTNLDEAGEPIRSGVARITLEHGLDGKARATYRDWNGNVLQVADLDQFLNPIGPPRNGRGATVQAAARPVPVEPAPRQAAPRQAARESAPVQSAAATAATAAPDGREVPAPAPPVVAEAPAPPLVESGGDLEAVVSDLVTRSEHLLEAYEEFLDREEREPEGEEEQLAERLEELGEAAGEVRKAYRRATGQGGGLRNALGLNRGAGTGEAARNLAARVRDLARVAAAVDGLAAKYPLGPEATSAWQQARRDLRRLESLVQ